MHAPVYVRLQSFCDKSSEVRTLLHIHMCLQFVINVNNAQTKSSLHTHRRDFVYRYRAPNVTRYLKARKPPREEKTERSHLTAFLSKTTASSPPLRKKYKKVLEEQQEFEHSTIIKAFLLVGQVWHVNSIEHLSCSFRLSSGTDVYGLN
jgi:hypothetical protein